MAEKREKKSNSRKRKLDQMSAAHDHYVEVNKSAAPAAASDLGAAAAAAGATGTEPEWMDWMRIELADPELRDSHGW